MISNTSSFVTLNLITKPRSSLSERWMRDVSNRKPLLFIQPNTGPGIITDTPSQNSQVENLQLSFVKHPLCPSSSRFPSMKMYFVVTTKGQTPFGQLWTIVNAAGYQVSCKKENEGCDLWFVTRSTGTEGCWADIVHLNSTLSNSFWMSWYHLLNVIWMSMCFPSWPEASHPPLFLASEGTYDWDFSSKTCFPSIKCII